MDILERKPNVVKSDLVEKVYKRVGFTRQEAEEAVDVIFKEIKTELASGDSVRIAGFASFYVKNKKARKARNFQTGEPIGIGSRKVLTFKPSKQLLTSTDSPLNSVESFGQQEKHPVHWHNLKSKTYLAIIDRARPFTIFLKP